MRKPEFEWPASAWMVTPVRSVPESASLASVVKLFEQLHVSALPVVDSSSRLTGVINTADLIRAGRLSAHAGNEPLLWVPERAVVEFMTTSVPVVRPYLPLWACAARMVDQRTRRLYVAEDGPLEGVLSTREMMLALVKARVETPLAELAEPAVSIASSSPLSAAHLASLRQDHIVVTLDKVPVGIFSRNEAGNSREAKPEDRVSLWMDTSVIRFAAATPTCVAADKAVKMGARYVVASDADGAVRVITGLAFARLVNDLD